MFLQLLIIFLGNIIETNVRKEETKIKVASTTKERC